VRHGSPSLETALILSVTQSIRTPLRRCQLKQTNPLIFECLTVQGESDAHAGNVSCERSPLLALVSHALHEGAVLRRVQVARLRELAGEHVQPRIRPEVEHSVKMELHWPCL
jgi:hypothetical protein